MIGRIGFVGRVILILLLGVFAVTAIGIGATVMLADGEEARASRKTIPLRIAAIVDLLANTPERRRAAVVTAMAAPDLTVRLADKPMRPGPDEQARPAVIWMLREALRTPIERDVVVRFRSEFEGSPVVRWIVQRSPSSGSKIDVSVSLAPGRYAIFTVHGAPNTRILGIPPGFFIGMLGALFAIFSIRAVMKEARPLSALRQSVEGFARDAVPRPVQPAGAPDLATVLTASNAMQQRIAQLIAGRTILIGAISHDLRTYLTRLRLRVETHPDETIREKAIADVEAMGALVDDAVAFAGGARPVEDGESANLQKLVDLEVAERGDDRVTLIDRVGDDIAVRGRDIGLRRVLNNLIDNAVRYGGRADVRLHCDGLFCTIDIDDPGPGIAPDQRALVFEPFARLEPSRNRNSGGAGLGLAIARQIVEASGGTIAIGTAPIGGARCSVRLPVVSEP